MSPRAASALWLNEEAERLGAIAQGLAGREDAWDAQILAAIALVRIGDELEALRRHGIGS